MSLGFRELRIFLALQTKRARGLAFTYRVLHRRFGFRNLNAEAVVQFDAADLEWERGQQGRQVVRQGEASRQPTDAGVRSPASVCKRGSLCWEKDSGCFVARGRTCVEKGEFQG